MRRGYGVGIDWKFFWVELAKVAGLGTLLIGGIATVIFVVDGIVGC